LQDLQQNSRKNKKISSGYHFVDDLARQVHIYSLVLRQRRTAILSSKLKSATSLEQRDHDTQPNPREVRIGIA
jgi:hypothetical protein